MNEGIRRKLMPLHPGELAKEGGRGGEAEDAVVKNKKEKEK